MDAVHFAGFWLRHQRIGTRFHLTRSRRMQQKTREARITPAASVQQIGLSLLPP
jgi:hypothetical protein